MTVKRRSVWRATVLLAASGLVAASGTGPAAAAGPPVGGCPLKAGFSLESVADVVDGADLDGPDPSMDPNGDGMTCLKLITTGQGTRATWHDNVIRG
jgi:hypothetical protein